MGWTWEYVERQVDLHRYDALLRQWRREPPLQKMVQLYLGIEPEEDAVPLTPENEDEAVRQFIANFAAAGGNVH